jgi:heptose-I-phosphate ethanolaminephosphotransferase
VRVFGIGVTLMHPLPLFAATQYNFKSTHRYYLGQYQQQHERSVPMAGAVTVPGAASPRVIVVVIGESATRRHWSLYGYARETTPYLQKRAEELLVFTDVISSSTGTLSSIRGMLSTSDSIPAFRFFSGAGYATRWISAQYNQGFDDLELAAFVSACEPRIYLSGAYDENLIPLLEKAVAEPGRQMVFLNLMGSHVRYQDRYPAGFAVFRGAAEAEHRRASYDNSIRYTDYVLDRMIALLRQRNESSCLIYFSDHGEDVYDSRPDKYLFRDDTLATDPMYEVPFVVWFSPEYVAGNADFVRRATAESPRRPFQNRLLYHTLLGLARLSHPLYDAHQDLFSPDFVARDRHVGAMERLYRKSP